MKYLFFILLLVAILITAGCVSEPKAPTTTISYNVVVPTVQTVQTVPTPPPSPIAPSIKINSAGQSSWIKYTNYDDHFSIYKPSDWTINELDKSQIPSNGEIDPSFIMNKFVYIYTPNLKGFIMIYGMDLSDTIYSLYTDPGKTQISDELYDAFVKGAESASLSSGNNQITVSNIEKDSNYYLINGNPARHVKFDFNINGQSLSTDSYVIAYKNAYYYLWYLAMPGSSQSDASTASNIMRTFITTT
jgi:hypothetical protein